MAFSLGTPLQTQGLINCTVVMVEIFLQVVTVSLSEGQSYRVVRIAKKTRYCISRARKGNVNIYTLLY